MGCAIILALYAVVVGVMYQFVPYDKKSYSQTEERMFKSVLWPFTLPFFIGTKLADKIKARQEKKNA